ncbi:MAG: phosphatase PAP2 family protein [Oscillospiraceae bacterium]|nr:phosphatase PAP2 family protein [Oscillospiraceae bacterium]
MERNKRITYANILLLIICAAGIAVGTGYDLDIARAVYRPDDKFWRFITIIGQYPFMALWVYYIGILCRQTMCSSLSKGKKTALCISCGYLALSTGSICSWSMFFYDTLGGVFPGLENSPPAIMVGVIFGISPLFFAGLFRSKREYDRTLVRRLVRLLIVMTVSFYILQIIKLCFARPRYRLIIQEIAGIGFTPWYMPFSGSKGLIGEMGLRAGDFRSFPSGHALECMGLTYVLPMLTYTNEKLKDRKTILYAAALVFAVMVCTSRMVMGAHFLSDVCAGSMLSLLASFIVPIRDIPTGDK